MEDVKIGAFFSRLDYRIRELAPVRDAEARGDRRAAEEAFLRYCRERPQPNLAVRYVSAHTERGFAQNTTGYDFISERYVEEFPDLHVTWRDRARMRPLISTEPGYTWSRTQGIKPSEYTLVDIADLLLDNKVFTPSEPEKGIQDVGAQWDWTHVPDDGDVIWTHHLNYQLFQRALAQAYWLTGDEAYIEKLIWIARHYVLYVDTKPEWIWFPGLQMNHSYLQLMPYILSWEGLCGHDLCLLLSLYTGPCIEEDMIAFANRQPPPQGNQLFYAGQGLITAGVGFPECRDARDWRELGLRIVGDYLGAGASYPDGTSKENSAGYVVGASTSVLETWLMLRDNGLSFPEEYVEVLLKRTAYLACSSKPDGSYVWNGDSRRGSALPFVGAVVAERYREDWDYVASRGERGRPPSEKSFWYPYCGHGIMRSSWQRDANYLQFDVGPIGTIHGHENALAVEIVSHGRSMVEDLGVHSYSAAAEDVLMQQFMSWSQGHNTVVVDGKTQVRDVNGPRETAHRLGNVWHSTEICDYLEGTYREGYAIYREERREDGVPRTVIDGAVDRSVAHARSVLFVKAGATGHEYWIITDFLRGHGSHTFEVLFHLVPTAVVVDRERKSARSADEGEPNIAFISAAPESVELDIAEGRREPSLQGWYAGGGGLGVAPAPCVIYRRSADAPLTIQTVVVPLQAGEIELPDVAVAREQVDGTWTRIAFADGQTDICCSARSAGTYRYGSYGFTGVAALYRRREGAVIAEEIVASRNGGVQVDGDVLEGDET